MTIYLFLIIIICYCFTLYAVVSTSPLLGRFTFSRFPVQSLIFTPISLLYTPKSPDTFFSMCSVARSAREGGVHWWCGGVPGLVRVFNQAVDLTCQPNSRFRIPVRIPFPQGTGESISSHHLLVGHCDGDCDLTIYPPLYLLQGFGNFFCHESAQLQEYDQGLPP